MTRTEGHLPTSNTKSIMPSILKGRNEDGEPKYNILLSMGRGWQDKQYENTESGNVFWGEPETGYIPPSPFGFEEDGLKWNITYSFEGVRQNVFGYTLTGKPLKYGADNMTFDRLYYILVNKFNGGEDFVSAYLENVAPRRLGDAIKNVISPALQQYKEYVSGQKALKEELEKQEKQAQADKEKYILDNADENVRINKNLIKAYKDIDKAERDLRNLDTRYVHIEEALYDTDNLDIFTKKGTIRKRLNYEDVFPEGAPELNGLKLWVVAEMLSELKYNSTAREEIEHRKTLAVRRKNKWESAQETYMKGLKAFITDLGSAKIKINGKSWEEESQRLSELLREDFANCLSSGIVPLQKSMLSKRALEARRKLDLDPDHIFYASGQFAESIRFKVRVTNG